MYIMEYKEIFKSINYNTPNGVNYKKAYEDLYNIDSKLSLTVKNLLKIIKLKNLNLIKLFLSNKIGYKFKEKIRPVSRESLFNEILEDGLLCDSPLKIVSFIFEEFEDLLDKVYKHLANYIQCINVQNFRYLLTLTHSKRDKLYIYEICIKHNRLDLIPEIKGLSAYRIGIILEKYKNNDKSKSNVISFLDKQLRLKSRKKSSISRPVYILRHKQKSSNNLKKK